jgi:hypothetical protein
MTSSQPHSTFLTDLDFEGLNKSLVKDKIEVVVSADRTWVWDSVCLHPGLSLPLSSYYPGEVASF